jgi:hypothetical protein
VLRIQAIAPFDEIAVARRPKDLRQCETEMQAELPDDLPEALRLAGRAREDAVGSVRVTLHVAASAKSHVDDAGANHHTVG